MLRWCFGPVLRDACVFALICATVLAGQSAPQIVTICDILSAPQNFDHKAVVVVGRLSKRASEQWIGQKSCATGETQPQNASQFVIQFNHEDAPLPPEDFALDSNAVSAKFKTLSHGTVLHDFPFGSGSYDRWGMVFGRVDLEHSAIICRGEALVFLWSGKVE